MFWYNFSWNCSPAILIRKSFVDFGSIVIFFFPLCRRTILASKGWVLFKSILLRNQDDICHTIRVRLRLRY